MNPRKGILPIFNALCVLALLMGCATLEITPTQTISPTQLETIAPAQKQTPTLEDSSDAVFTAVAQTLRAMATQTAETRRTATPSKLTATPVQPATPTYSADATDKLSSLRFPGKERSIIFDDDGSRDGTAALLYLLSLPEISIKAVTISYGEAHPDVYIQHIGRMLDYLGYGNIPLGAGQDKPLGKGNAFPDWLRQLSDNFWNVPLPNAGKTYPVKDAAELMVETLKNAEEPLMVITTGPFTTLARALRLDPNIREKIKAVYSMGGAFDVPGNIMNLIPETDNKVAEWNIYADPQAAKEVFEAGLKLYLIPLDATNLIILDEEEILPWKKGDEKAQLAAQLYETMFNEFGFEEVEIFDLTAAVLMAKGYLCGYERTFIHVITNDGPNFGQTLADYQSSMEVVVATGGPTPRATLGVPVVKPDVWVCKFPEKNADPIMQELEFIFTWNETPSIDSIIGKWAGTVASESVEGHFLVNIEKTCQLGLACGRVVGEIDSCPINLTWIGLNKEYFQFSGDSPCGGSGRIFLAPLADGSLSFLWRGSNFVALGILTREP